jgi:PKD repeat protein
MGSRSPRVFLVGLLALGLPACQEDQIVTPELSATCEPRPAAGPAPLAVSFLLNIAGAEGTASVSISYGDGTTGSNPDAPHTYATTGSYTASFDVRTSTQSARCSTTISVTTPPDPRSANRPPDGVFRTSPEANGGFIVGTAPLSVGFDLCLTSDPEGDELFFEMDFEGDGKSDFKGITGFHCRATHTYATAGTYRPLMCVYDRDKDRNALHDSVCQVYTVVVS